MYDYTTMFFWYRALFLLELLIPEGLFVFLFPRRSHFVWRLSGTLLVLFSVSFALPIVVHPLYYAFLFVVLFLGTLGGMFFCFAVPFDEILFCGIASYSFQHIAYLLFDTCVRAFYLDKVLDTLAEMNPYFHGAIQQSGVSVVTVIAYITVYFCVYWIAYFVAIRKLKKAGEFHIKHFAVLVLVILVILADVALNLVTVFHEEKTGETYYLERFYNLLVCFISLLLQYSQLRTGVVESRLKTVQALWKEKKKQYKLSQRTITLLNVKAHDLKYQQGKASDGSGKEEINDLVSDYQDYKETGNEPLNVVLTEKAMEAKKHRIRFDVIADGSSLSFMDPVDLYSLLGNGLDNAFTYVTTLPYEQRLVSLKIEPVGSMVLLRIENPFFGNLKKEEGRIKTTKEEKDDHGYGIISMEETAKKYSGSVQILTDHQSFVLSILLLPEVK